MTDPDPSTFADRLRWARLARGLRQAELARRANIPQSSLHKYERRGVSPDGERVSRLAAALDVPVMWLATGEGPEGGGIDEDLSARPPDSFAARLRWARQNQGMKQSDLARALGVPQSTIYKYEKKGVIPSGARVMEFAETLGCSIAWLSTGAGDAWEQRATAAEPFDPEFVTTQVVDALRGSGLLSSLRHFAVERQLSGAVRVELLLDEAALSRLQESADDS